MPLFFWFDLFFEARVEVQKYFRLSFGSDENFDICFCDLLTFSSHTFEWQVLTFHHRSFQQPADGTSQKAKKKSSNSHLHIFLLTYPEPQFHDWQLGFFKLIFTQSIALLFEMLLELCADPCVFLFGIITWKKILPMSLFYFWQAKKCILICMYVIFPHNFQKVMLDFGCLHS